MFLLIKASFNCGVKCQCDQGALGTDGTVVNGIFGPKGILPVVHGPWSSGECTLLLHSTVESE